MNKDPKSEKQKLAHDCEFFLITNVAVYACECDPHHIMIDNIEYTPVQAENHKSYTLLDFLQKEFDKTGHGNTTQVQFCYKEFEHAAKLFSQSENQRLTEENGKLKELLSETEAVQDKTALILKSQTINRLKEQKEDLTKINEELVKSLPKISMEMKFLGHTLLSASIDDMVEKLKKVNHEQS